ncbi:MAG: sodium-translocating pyrophosphatase [Acidobacteria bacterium]|nr:sodium-translocating pyrophosphatase [Acidobacteriota bacterium]
MAMGVLSLAVAAFYASQVLSADPGNEEMVRLMSVIRKGAMAFLRREYLAIVVFVALLAVLLVIFLPWGWPWGAVAYVFGASLSALAGFIGMRIATAANARTAEAARQGGVAQAFPVAFHGGAVMGFTVAGLGLLGFSLGIWFFRNVLDRDDWVTIVTAIGLGASSIALFARIGGGIYTKAADVGADLVGKVEAGIPEDDPRNPAVIADNVGDNVGDVAGMGADLFESYMGSLVAPITYAVIVFGLAGAAFTVQTVFYPLAIAAIGMLASIIGSFLVRPGKASLGATLERGTWVATGLTILGIAILTPALFNDVDGVKNPWGFFGAVLVGLIVGVAIGRISMWFTSDQYKVVKEVARQAQTGAATVILSGVSEGMKSAAYSVMVVAAGMGAAFWAGELAVDDGGIYGVAIAAIGVLATLGITVSVDAYGPIADNAGGIAEMAHLAPEVRDATDELDALGNTTAAVAKGFAIGSAAVTALALFFTFFRAVNVELEKAGEPMIESLDLLNIWVIVGLFIGGMFPYLFGAQTIQAVGRSAVQIIEEVRRQFREIPGLREGDPDALPDYDKVIDIATRSSLREMVIPGTMAVALPLVVGFISIEMLGGVLAGALVSGFLLAIYMANAGGMWDNAKKFVEAGAFGGKGSEAHKAAVVGDTVGDPFKDTAGPSMNIVIKVMTIVSLIFSSAFVSNGLF